MTFQQRLILLVSGLVVLAVLAVTAVLAWTTHGALSSRTETDARMAAGLLARAAAQARDIPQEVEALLGERLLSEATLTAHLVALAETAKLAPKPINERLKQIADQGGPEEMWVTDNRGRAYLHNLAGPDPLFGQDSKTAPRHAAYTGLLNRSPASLVSEAAVEGGKLMKFAGVAGVDRPRIVQVGADVRRLADIAKKAGADGLIDAMLATRAVEAAWLLDREGRVVARGAVIGESGGGPLSEFGTEAAKAVATAGGDLRVVADGDNLLGLAPIRVAAGAANGQGTPAVAVVRLSGNEPAVLLHRQLKIAGLLGVLVLGIGGYAAIRFARNQMDPVERLSEAVKAVEAGRFNPFTLNEATARDDEFGRLSRVFRSMAMEATAREETLDSQLLLRNVELESKTEKLAVAEHILEEEQRVARDVQANLLPRQLPAGRDSQFFGALVPAHAVSGDFYDVIELDETTTLLVAAGVSGGGVPAAFLMLMVRGAIRELARPGISPATILAGANDRLCDESPFNGFATAFVAVYDRTSGSLRHAAAGHRGACRVQSDGTVEPLTETGGPALGVRKGAPYAEGTATLQQDDSLFLCTEGVLRSADAQRVPFGEERLIALLQQSRGMSARDRAELVLRSVQAHAGPEGVAGDLVCLVLRRLLPVAETAEAV
ncbi:PP2C family protein-serine/threonine phosphatase [Azospirillum doebereinerae]|uniref:HAMP domain-containing protein n=1 Tax=Azospirillum doebereinerae TaxID=92933 RepID=A0A3S0X9U8_9PROT|nr:PP2C family protein-serine/threonine phosphatase [Azospirillum doebereinerae]RUQ68182.1 HAMP domain-containing protein [Azospirillum doebereinerae]